MTPAEIATTVSDRAVVQQLLDLGFRLVFWRGDGDAKGPREKDWQLKGDTNTLAEYHEGDRAGMLTGVDVNVRAKEKTDHPRYLTDADIDWSPGAAIPLALLPATAFIYGRASKPISHAAYTTPEPLPSVRFEDPIDKICLLELRGTKQDGTIGLQSMCPPSIHSKGGKREPLTFPKGLATPTHLTRSEDLLQSAALAAAGMLLAKRLGAHGFGHDARLAFAGCFLRLNVPHETVITLGEKILAHCGNNDGDDIRTVVSSTVKNLANANKRVKGSNALAKCLGDHGKTIIDTINEWMSQGNVARGGIVMAAGNLPEIVDQAEAALRGTGDIYQRSGLLVRAIKLDSHHRLDEGSVHRPLGAMVLVPIREPWLIERMARVVSWYAINAKGEVRRADPASMYARILLDRGQWHLPTLRGVMTAPTLDRDGRIIETPGFDPASGLLLDFAAGTFPAIPTHPTEDDARNALELLKQPFRQCPFEDDASRSVVLSGVLSALIRPSLRTCPIHGIDAPTAGSGKSLAAEAIGLIATGVAPASMAQGATEDETEKRLATVLACGDRIILIDNVEHDIKGEFLCSMVTQEIVQARILGQSERRILPSTALVLATGNNLTFAGDASRRAVICRLDAKVERPDTRTFDFDMHEEIRAQRSSLVVAGLTILRAYVVAGRPSTLSSMGSFADYDWIRGALTWLGCADPADTRTAILNNDPKRDELIAVMDQWEKAFGCAAVTLAFIPPTTPEECGEHMNLHNKLIEVACRGGKWNARSVGWWLRRHQDRVVGGKAFRRRDGKTSAGAEWYLTTATKGDAAEAPSAAPVAACEEDLPF